MKGAGMGEAWPGVWGERGAGRAGVCMFATTFSALLVYLGSHGGPISPLL